LKTNSSILLKVLGRKIAVIILLAVTALGSFATLGDGKVKGTRPVKKSLLSTKTALKPGSFSLRSGYNFRGAQVINTEDNSYINLNTLVTYQNGRTTYIIPLKKKVLLNDKIVFNPNASTRH
jgi:hypothetical protein